MPRDSCRQAAEERQLQLGSQNSRVAAAEGPLQAGHCWVKTAAVVQQAWIRFRVVRQLPCCNKAAAKALQRGTGQAPGQLM